MKFNLCFSYPGTDFWGFNYELRIINYELFKALAIASMPLAENVIFATGVRMHVE